MEATVIWNQLLELSATERLWPAEAYIVDLSARTSKGESEAEDADELESELFDPESTIYKLPADSTSVGTFFAQALKTKVAQAQTRALRPYDYLADGKVSVMFLDLEEHNDAFLDVIKRIEMGDFEETSDIDEAKAGSFFLVQHDLTLAGQKLRCFAGRKTYPRRLAKHVRDSEFPTVGVIFEDGKLQAIHKSYFEFDDDIDFLLVDNKIFIFNKYFFEQSTRFVKKMYEQTDEAWAEIADALFVESENMLLDMLTDNPKKARRKVAKIKKSEDKFFADPRFIEQFEHANREEDWGFVFERNQDGDLKVRFPYTDENKIDTLLTVLNDGRLYSKITGRTYDTDNKREVKRNPFD